VVQKRDRLEFVYTPGDIDRNVCRHVLTAILDQLSKTKKYQRTFFSNYRWYPSQSAVNPNQTAQDIERQRNQNSARSLASNLRSDPDIWVYMWKT
jgi:hypothetical protein